MTSTSTGSPRYLDERVEVSDDQQVETINVPQFDEGDRAAFVHDFNQVNVRMVNYSLLVNGIVALLYR